MLKAQQGDKEAIETLVKSNIGLVWSIVHRFKNSHYDTEDLFQIGCIGLMKAIYHFDVSYQVQFSTYAVPIILGEIKRFFRDDGCIKVSRSLKELNIRINKAREQFQKEGILEPSVEMLSEVLHADVQDIVLAIDSSYYPTSLSEPIYEKDGSQISLGDRVEDKKKANMVEKIALEAEISQLSKKEQELLFMRYKLDYKQERIAKMMGISQVQVSRIEKRIIDKLKAKLVED